MADFNPTVALGVTPPASPAPLNPLETAGALVNIRNAANQNVLFQQTMAARRKLGEIMAAAPSPEEGIAAAQREPSVSAFVPDLLQTISATQSASLGREAQIQDLVSQGMSSLEKAELPALTNPGLWESIMQSQRAAIAPAARPMFDQGAEMLKKSMIDGLPSDPAAALAEFRKRAGAMAFGAGVSPESVYNAMGTTAPSLQSIPMASAGGAAVTGIVGGAPGEAPHFAPLGLGQSSAPVAGLTPGQQALQGQQAANEAGTQKIIAQQASQLPSLINRLDVIRDAMRDVKLGGGAEAAQSLAEAAQALKRAGVDISTDTIDKIAGGDLGALQVLHADIGQMLAQATAQTFAGSGSEPTAHYINAQVDALSHESDPRAAIRYINNILANLRVESDKVDKYGEWQKELEKGKVTPGNFDQWYWSTQYDPEKLPLAGPASSSVNLAPISPEEVKGAEEPAPAGDKTKRSLKDIFGF